MTTGDPSAPIRFGQGNHATDTRNLMLKVYGGEVLAAFDSAVLTLDKHEVRTIKHGKSAQFPKTWKATSEYHTPGTELLGTNIGTTEVTLTVDDILVSHTSVSDLDEMLAHFDVRSKFAEAMGYELSKVYDKNVFRSILLAARASADGDFPAGNVITDAALTNTGVANGDDWVGAIRQARRTLYGKDVPEHMPLYFAGNENVWDAIKYAVDTNGNYLVLNRDFGTQDGGVAGHGEVIHIDGVSVYRSRHLPSVDETSATGVYTKYRANYATTTGVLWAPMAVGTVKMMDIGFETQRDTRRLEDFMLAKMLVGHGTLRAECALEFKTS